jgi:prephenate dehydratase
MKIAIQGTEASFHHQAAMKFFNTELELIECKTFEDVCKVKADGKCEYAVLAIENTLAGSFLPNYNLLQEYNLRILGEVYLHIEQNLLCLPGQSFSDIRFVRSHPMALLQCSQFLQDNQGITAIEAFDTAGSAREIKKHLLSDTAAIAGRLAAETFGLEVLIQGIENIKENHTRFMILDGESSLQVEPDKASISYTLSHEVGSLADTLKIFQDSGINLTKIQSVPILGKPYEYKFHVDLEWEDKDHYTESLKSIRKIVDELDILGEYERGEKTIYLSEEF